MLQITGLTSAQCILAEKVFENDGWMNINVDASLMVYGLSFDESVLTRGQLIDRFNDIFAALEDTIYDLWDNRSADYPMIVATTEMHDLSFVLLKFSMLAQGSRVNFRVKYDKEIGHFISGSEKRLPNRTH